MNPNILVIHYTALTRDASINAFRKNPNISIHYIIDELGNCISYENAMQYSCNRVVSLSNKAFHTGISFWKGESDVNNRSIGVELVNVGFSVNTSSNNDLIKFKLDNRFYKNGFEFWYKFPDLQIKKLIEVCNSLIKKFNIKKDNIVSHADVSLGRKVDPGPAFPYKLLSENGIGIVPSENDIAEYKNFSDDLMLNKPEAIKFVTERLSEIGYGVFSRNWDPYKTKFKMFFDNKNDEYFLKMAILAFKMHYCKELYNIKYLSCDLDATLISCLAWLTKLLD